MQQFTVGRRGLLGTVAALAVLPGARALAAVSPAAAEVYRRAIVIDALGGPGSQWDEPGQPFGARSLADVRASGLTAVNLTVSDVGNGPDTFENTVGAIAFFDREIALHPDIFLQVRSAADLKAAKVSGRLGLIYGFQDTALLGGKLDRLETFDALGVRIVQPTYNRRNLAGDGSLEPANGGLSTFGREVVAELNKRRMLVDCSHAGPRTIAETIAASKAPVAITHTGCRDLVDNPRNVWDAELKALANRGGVVGIYFMPFLRSEGQQHAEDVIRHLEHAVEVCGEDHVGLGTDGGISATELTPEFRKQHAEFVAARTKAGIAAPGERADVFLFAPEYNTPRRFETLAGDLLARGWSTTRVEKILGGNFARLFGEVWG